MQNIPSGLGRGLQWSGVVALVTVAVGWGRLESDTMANRNAVAEIKAVVRDEMQDAAADRREDLSRIEARLTRLESRLDQALNGRVR